ncbi:MAG: gamma carbonic anhydrase family protein [Bacteroidota bacterium]|nr:gamma carbonic anhydrase family protein [Bacteroidota bacterium]
MIHKYQNKIPKLISPSFTADSAEIIGDVLIMEDASIWFNAVIRGDINSISIGKGTNIQDGAIIHVSEVLPTIIGEGVTVGHRAILHACSVGNYSLIGMGSCILDGSVIGNYTLVAAGSVVLQNMKIPDGSLVAGVPAKVMRQLRNDEKNMLEESARNYIIYAKSYLK